MSAIKELFNEWAQTNALSRFLVISVIGLLTIAYLPTLQFDYVTQDQWRAFRYQSNVDTPIERLKECSSMVSSFYTQTGRPLVWPTECLEHAFVSEISDFKYLRPFALALVIFTAIYLSLIIRNYTGEWLSALTVASIFLTAPAYSFMYLQGWPALMVLFSICFAGGSYKSYITNEKIKNNSYTLLIGSSVFFLAACMIYPAFAFIVLPLALIRFVGESNVRFTQRIKNLINTLTFYAALSAVYYIFVKLSVFSLVYFKGSLPSLGSYEVSAQLSPNIILDRINEAATYFSLMPPANFPTFRGVTLAILIVFSAIAGIKFSSIGRNGSYTGSVYYTIATFLVSSTVLLASTSPWLFSKMDSLATRHLLPFYLFTSFAIVWIAKELLPLIFKEASVKKLLVTPIIIFLPIALYQNKMSFLEVASTTTEIEMLRAKLSDWSRNEEHASKRFILIVRPELFKPLGIERLIHEDKYGNDNAVLASSENPVSIPWMVKAVLEETNRGQKHNVIDCGFDTETCVQKALANKGNIVIAYTGGVGSTHNKVINSPTQPYVINFSELTSRTTTPEIRVVELPSIVATSVLGEYGPEGLFMQIPPGWHAEINPVYPQALKIDFKKIKSFDSIYFLPQDTALISRSPKKIRIKISDDEQTWAEVLSSTDVCTPNEPDGWHKFNLPRKFYARYVKVEILANCGDPEFLTLLGLKVE